ncbi:MAG: HAD-IA family hydrolase [Amaricoccus sp.]|uniref:HAD-IA family hydrolase n=1 Tax=Amaricoccus sp. TaxID=1872485 RepID=UPI0039E489D6
MDCRLIVFDVDGTLVDSQHLILEAMQVAFDFLGETLPPRETALSVVGLSLPEAMAALLPHRPPEETLKVAESYRRHFSTQRATRGTEASAPLYPGAVAALERLAADPATRLGVATGKARRGLDHLLDAHGLRRHFVTLQCADDHPSKPHPSMLLTALAESGVPAERAAMVGDTEYDIAMGRAAGLHTVGVTWGYHPAARLRAAGADVVIQDFAELDGALARLGLVPA